MRMMSIPGAAAPTSGLEKLRAERANRKANGMRYRVKDDAAKHLGGIPVNDDRTITLLPKEAQYWLDQKSIIKVE